MHDVSFTAAALMSRQCQQKAYGSGIFVTLVNAAHMIANTLTWSMNPVGIFHTQWNSAGSVLMIRPA
jgi:hypothetical protein